MFIIFLDRLWSSLLVQFYAGFYVVYFFSDLPLSRCYQDRHFFVSVSKLTIDFNQLLSWTFLCALEFKMSYECGLFFVVVLGGIADQALLFKIS